MFRAWTFQESPLDVKLKNIISSVQINGEHFETQFILERVNVIFTHLDGHVLSCSV